MKKLVSALLALTLVGSLAACGSQNTPSASASGSAGGENGYKIVLISNQKSGDMGPVDAMFAGAKRAEADFGVTVKTMEVTDAASYEEEIRAMAKEGYDLILTTFSPMTEATKAVAADYPDVKFAAVFQNINVDGESYPNVWDTEYRGEECTYVTGDVSDNSALCPDGFYAYMGIDFGENIYLAVKQLVEGNFPGGEHGYMNIASGTYFVDTALLDALAEKMPEKADKFQAAKEAGEAAMAGIKDGSIQVVHDIELPDLDRVKGY